MSRRFTLFALLAAVCMLFVSCGALFIKAPVSNKGSIVIPLRSSDRKASSPLELCTRFVFSIESKEYSDTAEGTTSIEFGEIPFGTYTLTGTAYGKLSEETNAQEEIVATCKVENLVINSPEPKAVDAAFTLSEATLIYFNGYEVEETDAQGTPITVVYTGTDKTTKISETKTTETQGVTTTTVIEYAIDADGNNTLKTDGTLFHAKETVTEPQSSGNRVTVTEYDYNAGNPQVSKTTVTEPDGKKTVSEFNLNTTTQGCSKRVTVEEGNTTTVSKYDTDEDSSLKEIEVTQKTSAVTTITTYNGSNWEGDLFAKQVVIDSGNGTTTTTENLSTNKAKTAKVTVEVTSGSDKGKTTVTEYDTAAAGTVRETVTVTNPDHSSVVTTFNDSDKETKKVESDTKGVQTTSLYEHTTNATTITTYQTGFDPTIVNTDPNEYHVATVVEVTYSGNAIETTATTDFEYTDFATYNVNNTPITPLSQKTTIIRNADNEIISRIQSSYSYTDAGKPLTFSTVKDGIEVAYDKYSYKADGTPDTYATKEDGEAPAYFAYRPIGLKVYSDTSMTNDLIFQSTGTTFFECPCTSEDFNDPDPNNIPTERIQEYLTNHYVLVGSTIMKENQKGDTLDDLNFITTSQIEAAHNAEFNYIFKVDFEHFTSCFTKGSIVSEGTGSDQCFYLKCRLHNAKNECSNFWGTNYNFSTAKDKYIITTTNYGCANDPDYRGVGKTTPVF